MTFQLACYISLLERKLKIKQINSKIFSSIFCLTFSFMSFVLCTEAATGEVLFRKGVLRNFAKFTRKHLCHFIKIETLAQMFSCEFCETSKNTFLTEHVWPTVSISKQHQAVLISFCLTFDF